MSWNEQIWINAGRNVCPVCKKVFYVEQRGDWVYKIKKKCCCSYTCWRKAQAPKPLKGTKKKRSEKI